MRYVDLVEVQVVNLTAPRSDVQLLSQRWSSNPPMPKSERSRTYHVKSAHAKTMYNEGSILWLPRREVIPVMHKIHTPNMEDGCFNHPVVLLEVNKVRARAVILIVRILSTYLTHHKTLHLIRSKLTSLKITSFNGNSISKKHSRNRIARL